MAPICWSRATLSHAERRTRPEARAQAHGCRRALEQSLLYSEELGINLAERTEAAYFRWFVASLLFGARISETTAKNTCRAFIRHGLTTPVRIVGAGWDFLVDPVMREGGYVRYDGRKSTQVLRDCETLLRDYHGGKRPGAVFTVEAAGASVDATNVATPDPRSAMSRKRHHAFVVRSHKTCT